MKNFENNEDKYKHLKTYFAGDRQQEGFYVCENCGQKLYLNENDVLMDCPRCTNKTFTKD